MHAQTTSSIEVSVDASAILWFYSRSEMVTGRLELKTPPRFNFWRTVYSHGWCSLPPFSVDKENNSLSRILELESGDLVRCTLRSERGKIMVTCSSRRALTEKQRSEVSSSLRECLRLNEDLSEFYKEANQYPHYRWIQKSGAGRLLRAPTVFEDVVKMICTTNCSWSLTEGVVGNLTSLLGKTMGDGISSFPGPHVIAGTTESFLRTNIRAGYRSPYLLTLATDVAEGRIDLESWRSSNLATSDLFSQIKTIKGMGDYAAGNILRLLGRYDYLGLDSWVRGKYYELHTKGRDLIQPSRDATTLLASGEDSSSGSK